MLQMSALSKDIMTLPRLVAWRTRARETVDREKHDEKAVSIDASTGAPPEEPAPAEEEA